MSEVNEIYELKRIQLNISEIKYNLNLEFGENLKNNFKSGKNQKSTVTLKCTILCSMTL